MASRNKSHGLNIFLWCSVGFFKRLKVVLETSGSVGANRRQKQTTNKKIGSSIIRCRSDADVRRRRSTPTFDADVRRRRSTPTFDAELRRRRCEKTSSWGSSEPPLAFILLIIKSRTRLGCRKYTEGGHVLKVRKVTGSFGSAGSSGSSGSGGSSRGRQEIVHHAKQHLHWVGSWWWSQHNKLLQGHDTTIQWGGGKWHDGWSHSFNSTVPSSYPSLIVRTNIEVWIEPLMNSRDPQPRKNCQLASGVRW